MSDPTPDEPKAPEAAPTAPPKKRNMNPASLTNLKQNRKAKAPAPTPAPAAKSGWGFDLFGFFSKG